MTLAVEQELIKDIVGEPANDGLRLILADWYEDHGQPERAEFIRTQIERAGSWSCDMFMYSCGELLPTLERMAEEGCAKCKRYASLRLCETELMRQYGSTWSLEVLSEEAGSNRRYVRTDAPTIITWADARGDVQITYSRGLVESIKCPLPLWYEHGRQIVRRHPIEMVTVTGRRPTCVSPIWQWDTGSCAAGTPSFLPAWVFTCLRGAMGTPAYQAAYPWRNYPTEKAAYKALSDALLLWARIP